MPRKSNNNNFTPPTIEPTAEEQRDQEMFKAWVSGMAIPAIAVKFGLSESQVFRIARRDRWRDWKSYRKRREYRKIVEQLDQRPKPNEKEELPPNALRVGDDLTLERIILVPKGKRTFGVIPPPSNVRLFFDTENGIIRIQTTYTGYFRSRPAIAN